jgi:hypothetical protein
MAGTAIFAACLGGQAVAATKPVVYPTTIKAGEYKGTLEFTSINDPFSLCATLISVGEVQTSIGEFALSTATATNSPLVNTPVVGSAATQYGVGVQSCTYTALPVALSNTGNTPINGTTTCTSPKGTFEIVTDGVNGSSAVKLQNTTAASFKITTTNAALEAPIGPGGAYQAICYFSTDSVFVRVGSN